MNNHLLIKRFILDGDDGCLSECQTVQDILHITGRRLDKACVEDIVGSVLFEGVDGKFYVGNVEFEILEANPLYVAGVLEDLAAEQKAEKESQ